MNAIDKTGLAPRQAGARALPPAIRYLDPLGADMARAVQAAADAGFTAILVPPPWAPGAGGDRFLPASLDRIDPRLGGGSPAAYLTGLATLCRRHGLDALVDVPAGAVAAEFDGGDAPFAEPPPPGLLDPRQAAPRVRRVSDPAAAASWWADRFAGMVGCGITGARVLGLDATPGAIATLRQAAPDAMLIAWTPGLAWDLLPGLCGADFTVCSQPWWDYDAGWFWDELEALRRIAPVLACPEVPFGARLAAAVHDPALLAATLQRAACVAAAIGDGWIVTDGFENGLTRRLGVAEAARVPPGTVDLPRLNASLRHTAPVRGLQTLSGGGAPVLAVLRTDAPDARFARRGALAVVNMDLVRARPLDMAPLLFRIDGPLRAFTALHGTPGQAMPPGGMLLFEATAQPQSALATKLDAAAAQHAAASPRVAIEAVTPCVDDGSLPVKRLVGEIVLIEADIICDGHDKLGVVLQWTEPGETAVHESRMEPSGNDRYRAELPLTRLGAYSFTIQAWRDAFASYRDEIAKKSAAGIDIALELREGMALLQRVAATAAGATRQVVQSAAAEIGALDDAGKLARFLSPDMAALMALADDRPRAATLPRPVRVDAERSGAAFAAWYEIFPRSMSGDPARHGTFADVERQMPRIRDMGFDVLYFPPIHPIGRINRKGPNNTLTPGPDDPGSPYAIGAAEGGHDALHPELGTLDDFRHMVDTAHEHGLEIAIDFAIQCSPDHPWLKQHRGWFDWRPDGSIKYAENPPKKYQDIVNVDFYATDAIPSLWVALADIVMFWMEQGVRLVRVDNPHTKPLPFWQWMIASVRQRYPDAVFLAEAFTRPKVMYRLAKVGFSQSYTYFTWRQTKAEMEQYLTELALPGPRDYFRPHFFVNTPDINPVYLQGAGRSAYLIRAVLAATLSGLWGVYCGFELCEGTPLPGREEYLDSEKYQIRVWDWDRPGNIVPEITALNRLRRTNPALRSHLTTSFLSAGNSMVSVYMKATPDRSNVLIVAVSYDPDQPQQSDWEFPFWLWQASETTAFEAEDVLGGGRATWRGKYQSVRIEPGRPYVIWRVRAVA